MKLIRWPIAVLAVVTVLLAGCSAPKPPPPEFRPPPVPQQCVMTKAHTTELKRAPGRDRGTEAVKPIPEGLGVFQLRSDGVQSEIQTANAWAAKVPTASLRCQHPETPPQFPRSLCRALVVEDVRLEVTQFAAITVLPGARINSARVLGDVGQLLLTLTNASLILGDGTREEHGEIPAYTTVLTVALALRDCPTPAPPRA